MWPKRSESWCSAPDSPPSASARNSADARSVFSASDLQWLVIGLGAARRRALSAVVSGCASRLLADVLKS